MSSSPMTLSMQSGVLRMDLGDHHGDFLSQFLTYACNEKLNTHRVAETATKISL